MPELPEVETTRRGVAPHVVARTVQQLTVRNGQLRWPIPDDLPARLAGQPLRSLSRRGKYLLLHFPTGTVLWHLGMSGSLRVVDPQLPPAKHDHVDMVFEGQVALRFNDPRRFGALLWADEPAEMHPLLAHLGPEPLTEEFNPDYLFTRSRGRTQAVKTWLMDSRLVVGVGNIYANEALFNAGIHPRRKPAKLTRRECERLVAEIKKVLTYAITRGGTTLRNFVGGDGKPGYFALELNVYGRGGQACKTCGKPLLERHLGQRTTVYCTRCQK